jgi:peptidoglycan/xylan/chitin deacetylase (PgdA/CDA1 family)
MIFHRRRRAWPRSATRAIDRVPPLRNAIIFALSSGRDLRGSTGWIRFAMYHDIPSWGRGGFARQLAYMRSFAEFLSIDDAVRHLEHGDPIDGRYICITFDDGYKSCYKNAFPILRELDTPAAFFVVPHYIEPGDGGRQESHDGRPLGPKGGHYLTWDECRRMVEGGCTIGSHSLSHARLAHLDEAGVSVELARSKTLIEQRVGQSCHHFACPWGQPHDDFQPDRDPAIAARLGYRSFFSTVRGKAVQGQPTSTLPREKVEPHWGNYHIRYFFSL